MKILIVAATRFEYENLQGMLAQKIVAPEIDFLETGVGMVAMAYGLTKRLAETGYDFIINIGIAGSIGPELPIGAVVAIQQDAFFELGAESGTAFLKVDELDLGSSQLISPQGFDDSLLDPSIPRVNGITVNTVHGTADSVAIIRRRSAALVESMEGAAFYFVCEREGLRSLQLRGISNRVELRNRESWNIPLALDRLNSVVMDLLLKL